MKVLLTGAAGGIGTRLRKLLPAIYPDLILSDLRSPPDLAPDERFVAADLADAPAVERAVDGVDAIVHLGGFSVEGPWETILRANIVGTYNLFEAARRAGVKRVVFASSNHVMGFVPRTKKIGIAEIPRPDSLYGVSKAYGEALGAYYAFKHGLRVLSIRIGNVADVPVDERRLAIWLAPEDLVSLIRIGLERQDLVYDVVYGMSDNARAWWDNSHAVALGYRPSGHSEEHARDAIAAQALLPADPIGDLYQGGTFCSDGFSASLTHIRQADRS